MKFLSILSFSPAGLTAAVEAFGVWPATMLSMALAVSISAGTYAVVQVLLGQSIWGEGLVYATLIPAAIAVPMEYRIFRLAGELLKSTESLQQSANRDFLTTCFNRRKFQGLLEAYWKEWTTHQIPFGILLFDLNNFKAVNDTYGHAAGDEILIEFSHLLERASGTTQSVFRLGGDEFAIVLGTNCEGEFNVVAERVCLGIEKSAFFSRYREVGLGASYGVGLVGEESQAFIDVLKMADIAMYLHKNRGYCQD